MAVQFRNLQGTNPYQGLANTMESVSGRVGASYMSWAQMKAQRDKERGEYERDKEKSMVNAIVKLVPLAAEYHRKGEAIEYGKEQDVLNREAAEQAAVRTADFRQSTLDEQIRGRKVQEGLAKGTQEYQMQSLKGQQKRDERTDLYRSNVLSGQQARDQRTDAHRANVLKEHTASREQTKTFQQSTLDAQTARDARTDEYRKTSQEFQQFLKKQTLKAAGETRKHQAALLASKESVTPLEEANSASTAIYNLNKSRDELMDAERLKWRLYTGQEIGKYGEDGHIPANKDAPGRVTTSIDGKDVSKPMSLDSFLKEQAGYSGGVNDPALKQLELKPYLLMYGSQKVKDLLRANPNTDPQDLAKSGGDGLELAALNNFLRSEEDGGNRLASGAAFDSDLDDELNDVESPVLSPTSVLEFPPAVDESVDESSVGGSPAWTTWKSGKNPFTSKVGAALPTSKEDIEAIIKSDPGEAPPPELYKGLDKTKPAVEEEAAVTMTVNTKTLNIRKSSSAKSQKIGTASLGAILNIISEKNGWAKVKLDDGSIGYVASRYLK